MALAAAAALLATGSKGAYLALSAAAALLAAGTLRGWRRLLPPLAVLLVLAAALASSQLRAGLALSAHVRLGYWQGAAELIGESPWLGHGLGGFAGESLRVMPLDAEPTRYVHNELLEAWADGGVLAAVLLIALFACLLPPGQGGGGSRGAGQPPPPEAVPPPGGSARALAAAAAALLVLVPLFGACGMLASNLEWWPGADGDAGWLAYLLALGALGGAAVVVAERLPLPPPWAWRLAILACALHCLIDFDLHSPGVRGCLAIIACCAAGGARSLRLTPRRLRRPAPPAPPSSSASRWASAARSRSLRARSWSPACRRCAGRRRRAQARRPRRSRWVRSAPCSGSPRRRARRRVRTWPSSTTPWRGSTRSPGAGRARASSRSRAWRCARRGRCASNAMTACAG